MPRVFALTDDQQAVYDRWAAGHPCEQKYQGAIGGAITFQFSPTSIGTIVKIECSMCGEVTDLTDYERF